MYVIILRSTDYDDPLHNVMSCFRKIHILFERLAFSLSMGAWERRPYCVKGYGAEIYLDSYWSCFVPTFWHMKTISMFGLSRNTSFCLTVATYNWVWSRSDRKITYWSWVRCVRNFTCRPGAGVAWLHSKLPFEVFQWFNTRLQGFGKVLIQRIFA